MEIFSFGERLMIYRKRAGLSKKELAKRVGISVSTLTKYENDESQPNVDMLTDLAIALDISVMKLLSGFGDPIREKYRQGLLNISLEKMNALQERHLLYKNRIAINAILFLCYVFISSCCLLLLEGLCLEFSFSF